MKIRRIASNALFAAVAISLALAMEACTSPEPLPVPTATPYPTHTPYPTRTPAPTATPYPTHTPYPTWTPVPTATPAPKPSWALSVSSFTLDDGQNFSVSTLSLDSYSGEVAGQRGFIPATINLQCNKPENEDAYLAVDVAWRSAIPTDAVTKDALTVFVKFDSGEWQIEEWNTSPPHDKRLYVPYGAESSYISDFIQHELFRLEIENSDGVILWNEWELSGLADWIDQPWELCELSGTGSPSTHLYNPIFPSEHMAYIWWEWKPDQTYFREMVTEFTIHNDVGDFSDRHGLHLILGQSSISDVRFYFGVQTDATRRGKGLIFSRWKTRDLANARYSEEDGWTESSGHGEDFIGVRRSYDWSAGNYRVRIAPDGLTSDGEWFGLWITDLDAGQTTWIGSLKFPLQEAEARIKPTSYSGIEIYGVDQIRPIDIPQWQVSVKRPQGDNVASIRGYTGYSAFKGDVLQNSDVRYDPSEDIVHLRAGGATERETAAGYVAFE